jgi:PAS domain S-box-containing protein
MREAHLAGGAHSRQNFRQGKWVVSGENQKETMAETGVPSVGRRLPPDNFFTRSPDPLCILGNDAGFQFVNPAFETVLAYAERDLAGKPFIAFIHPDDRAAALGVLNHPQRRTASFEARFRRNDGLYSRLEWSTANHENG